MKQTNELEDFWNELKLRNAKITLLDIDELEKLLGKVFLKIHELKESRDKWKARALGK